MYLYTMGKGLVDYR